MDLNFLIRLILLGFLCLQISCANDNGSPECENKIVLDGVKDALYREIAQGGDQYRFKTSLTFEDIETVKMTEEGRVCSARLLVLKKYYLPVSYEIAVDKEEYFVTFSGIDEGSLENIYKVINNLQPNLESE